MSYAEKELVAVPRVVYVASMEESERGWGQRFDGYVYCLSPNDIRSLHKQCEDGKRENPSEFSYATSVRLVQLTEEGFAKVIAGIKGNSKPWFWTNENLIEKSSLEVML